MMSPRDLLLTRKRTQSRVGERADDAHLALILEGGGMRGVVSIAMAAAFEASGFLDAFDSVHGSSAGACNAAYFAAGRADLGTRIYLEDINNRDFIDIWRPLRGRAIMDKSLLIDRVMQQAKPLDAGIFVDHPGYLNIVTTDAKTGDELVFSEFATPKNVFDALRASICLPLIAGYSVKVDGRSLVDGGIVQQIAVDSAAARGATHCIVLMTRSQEEMFRNQEKSFDWEAFALRAAYGGRLASVYAHRNALINRTVSSLMEGAYESKDGRSIRVDTICRDVGSVYVDRLCIERQILDNARVEGEQAATKYIG